jgi:Cu-Zn family superoxide dismutase
MRRHSAHRLRPLVGTCVLPAINHPSHAADMPVLLVGADGTAQASFTTDRLKLTDVLDSDGGADAMTLATGDSGGRVACGVVTGR